MAVGSQVYNAEVLIFPDTKMSLPAFTVIVPLLEVIPVDATVTPASRKDIAAGSSRDVLSDNIAGRTHDSRR